MVAQLIGSFLGALLTWCLSFDWNFSPLTIAKDNSTFNKIEEFKLTTTWYQAGLIETLNTFFLMLVILSFTQKKEIPKSAFGGAIGLVLTTLICGSGPLTGCAANPFRALGPNLLAGNFFPLAIY